MDALQHTGVATDRGRAFGTLYVISTPIGNLEDITIRALRILKSVDRIAAESVAHTRQLCKSYGIDTALTSYHQHNQGTKTGQLIGWLKSGKQLALVTDAGTPGISDPGARLISLAAEKGIKVVPVPGPSALVAALSVSGLQTDRFLFLGFLSSKPGKRKKELNSLVSETRTMVFYEAPHRIQAMLADLQEIFGERQMVAAREMTKVFEEILRGTPADILASLTPEKIKGEFTLVVAGSESKQACAGLSEEALQRIDELIQANQMSVKDIAALISKEAGLPYRQAYRACLEKKNKLRQEGRLVSVKRLTVKNSLGLHARSAAKIVTLGRQYRSRLFLKKDGEEVDGSSILSILTLSCPKGTEMEARIVGEDSELFMEQLSKLFEQKFGEKA
ncbi:MAG: 16S rRNA (cytidine(1402)-2'-O)-methyltransferase [Deltaproteobacteria bacterium]|nr:16S rRNA (cytidine(1402)-2'-O)-methyltransferase [Deltaproteobacteria bacterium]